MAADYAAVIVKVETKEEEPDMKVEPKQEGPDVKVEPIDEDIDLSMQEMVHVNIVPQTVKEEDDLKYVPTMAADYAAVVVKVESKKEEPNLKVEPKEEDDINLSLEEMVYVNIAPQTVKEEDDVHLTSIDFKCDLCNYVTNLKENLDKHLITHISIMSSDDTLMVKVEPKHEYVELEPKQEEGVDAEAEDIDPLGHVNSEMDMVLPVFKEENGEIEIRQDHLLKGETFVAYKCQRCDYITNLIEDFNLHCLTHNIFKCDQCDYTTDLKRLLQQHNSIHIRKETYNMYLTMHILKKHTVPEVTHTAKRLKCHHCGYTSNRESYFKLHLLSHRPTKELKCLHCNFATNIKYRLRQHMSVHSTKNFKCTQCDYAATRKEYLKLHCLSKHVTSKQFNCDKCNFATNLRDSLNKHVVKHNPKHFKCEHCKFATNRSEYLKTHALSHKTTKDLKCFHCNFETNVKSTLRNHMSVHSTLKNFKCDHCNYASSRKDILKLHCLAKHATFKKLKCDKCAYATNLKRCFNNHVLRHNPKHLKCDSCKYATNKEHNFKVHLVSHQSAKKIQ
ncbi:zinc finger protein 64-like [Photinus pyralis]|nr:zinc finger protein 64-like [Photinus pyralis]